MTENLNNERVTQLKSYLQQAMLLIPLFDKGVKKEEDLLSIFSRICKIVFGNNFFLNIADEPVLNQLIRLFESLSPNQNLYGEELNLLKKRAETVQKINDLFYSILTNGYSLDDVIDRLSILVKVPESTAIELEVQNQLNEVRRYNKAASIKIEAFVDYLKGSLGMDFGVVKSEIFAVLNWLKYREKSAGPNALLIHDNYGTGYVVPLQINLQDGDGHVKCLVPNCGYFVKAIDRALAGLIAQNLVGAKHDVVFSLDVTNADYVGDSIALSAAMGIYASAQQVPIDPYTAFTGNINLVGQDYKIKSVKGIQSKLKAASLGGCRRVFIPFENHSEVEQEDFPHLTICPVNTINDVLQELDKPFEHFPEKSKQDRKLKALQVAGIKRGWHVLEPTRIQAGYQIIVSPPNLPELKINVHDTGTHTCKKHSDQDLNSYLEILDSIDESGIPIQSINDTILVKSAETQVLIQQYLDDLNPTLKKKEQYCLYSYVYEDRNEKVNVKQFTSGKLVFQGKAGELYYKILNSVIPTFNRQHPGANLKIEDYIQKDITTQTITSGKELQPVPSIISFPHIGTDESGKGDYFGPMVIAGVWVDESLKKALDRIGVRDSKKLSDKRCQSLAKQIKEICQGKYHIVEINPERYNTLYNEFSNEGKNLNHLLAWGHARAVESLIGKKSCSCAIADQFGDEKYILSKLMEKGKKIELIQTHKGERYTAVAAASILARDQFLTRLDQLSEKYQLKLPKGASEAIVIAGKKFVKQYNPKDLGKIGKLHHKTTKKIVEKNGSSPN
ncbi:MAG: ribonuclease HIII [Deltaproteobacteria bacterium]|nr:ribonuclease HIII [Deltaproteobacteria bacterium]